jgi:hypothetical protein
MFVRFVEQRSLTGEQVDVQGRHLYEGHRREEVLGSSKEEDVQVGYAVALETALEAALVAALAAVGQSGFEREQHEAGSVLKAQCA